MKRSTPLLALGMAVGCLSVAAAARPRRGGRFARKVVVIAGSSRGLGLALAEEFGRQGARLVLAARDSGELDAARRKVLARVGKRAEVLTVVSDLREEAQAKRMIHSAIERFGRVDVLVNCAGVISVGPVENQPVTAFIDAIESNYYSALYTTLAAIPEMLARRRGNIVNIASIGGKIAIPHLLPYSASKFALVGFSQGLHAELRPKGIRVTTVCPGLMRTGSHIQALFAGDQEREYRWFSLGATLPFVSASAKSAARKIVRATARGATEIAITPQAIVVSRLAQVAPGTTARLLSSVNDLLLPPPTGDGEQALGEGGFRQQGESDSIDARGAIGDAPLQPARAKGMSS